MKKHGRYVWVPAALENDLDGVGIYIRYHKFVDRPIKLKRQTGRYVWFDTPDREIIVQRERYYANDPAGRLALHPENYDEYVHIDVNNTMVMKDLNLEFGMVNATTVNGSGHRRSPGDREGKHAQLMVDSGGFQLYAGTTDFVDPMSVIQTHNLHGDLGMVLDIPVPDKADKELAKRLAWVQNKNTELMLKHKRDDLNLINILHGESPEIYKMYRKEVERDELNHVAFGFARRGSNPLRGIRKVTDLLTMDGKKYKHYHILGISDLVKTLPLMWLAKMNVAPLITADSSTPVRNAANGLYHSVRSPLAKIEVSRKWSYQSRLTTLPCGCAVCSRLKYSDALPHISGALMTRVLTFHNLMEHIKYFKTAFQVCLESETIDEFLSEMKWSITRDRHEEARIGLQIVETGVNDGMKAVDKRFEYHLHKAGVQTEGLFGKHSDVDSLAWEKLKGRIENAYTKYRKYHGAGKRVSGTKGKTNE
jgi:tRNA-guanine family transglycosylase